MKLNGQINIPSPGVMRSGAALILVVFCALLFLQTACTAGVLSHCDHQAAHDQNLDHCGHDRCGDTYPVPGKISAKNFVSNTQWALPAFQNILDATGEGIAMPYCQPIVSSSPRPAGAFPLLI